MAEKTGTVSPASKAAAERWRAGTEHYLAAYAPVAQRIHEQAKVMGGEDPEAIVAMAIDETTKFAREYHERSDGSEFAVLQEESPTDPSKVRVNKKS